MRQPRLKAPEDWEFGYYHCVSRVVDRRMVLGEEEKAHFAKLLRLYEQVCQVRVVTYCVMANHFHVLVEVPAKPKVMPTEEQLLGPHWPMLRETPPGLRGDRDSPAPSFRR